MRMDPPSARSTHNVSLVYELGLLLEKRRVEIVVIPCKRCQRLIVECLISDTTFEESTRRHVMWLRKVHFRNKNGCDPRLIK